jgi:hypothetical protein
MNPSTTDAEYSDPRCKLWSHGSHAAYTIFSIILFLEIIPILFIGNQVHPDTSYRTILDVHPSSQLPIAVQKVVDSARAELVRHLICLAMIFTVVGAAVYPRRSTVVASHLCMWISLLYGVISILAALALVVG